MTIAQPAHLPHTYPRRILLAVSGLSPQIITETLYALVRATEPAFMPTEVHVITTLEGRKRICANLLDQPSGWFHRLCEDYQLPPIAFPESHIHVLETCEGQQLDDIRSARDNEQMADFITERVQSLTADPETSLHVSLAGGRKTMGFYMGYALSLYGRIQDRLSHVLVSPKAYESHPEFYYPTPTTRLIYTREQKPLDTAQAEVTLAEIPFVRLREELPSSLLQGPVSFSQTIQMAQQRFTPHIYLNCKQGLVQCADQRITLKPAEFVFYLWFLKRRQAGEDAVRWSDEGVAEAFLDLNECYGSNDSRTGKTLTDGMNKDYFDERKSRVNRTLQLTLGKSGAKPYLIHSEGKRPETRYRVSQIEASAIQID